MSSEQVQLLFAKFSINFSSSCKYVKIVSYYHFLFVLYQADIQGEKC